MATSVSIGWQIDDLAKFDDSLEEWKLRMEAANKRIVDRGGQIIANNAKLRFGSGDGAPTPGKPTRRTGQTQDSYETRSTSQGLGSWMSETGPTVKWGRRLELGYHGVDSLGRNYGPPNKGQPPYPSLGPGLRASRYELDDMVHEEWEIAQNG